MEPNSHLRSCIYLRPMTAEDIPQVAAIERESFPTLWPPTAFKRELSNRLAEYLVVYIDAAQLFSDNALGNKGIPTQLRSRGVLPKIVYKLKRLLRRTPRSIGQTYSILGFVGLWFMAGEAHITAIAVHGEWRGRGIGELLLIGAIQLGIAQQCQEATLEVRVSNDVAQSLYEKYGFHKKGIRHSYYTDNREDALIMTTDSLSNPKVQKKLQDLVFAYQNRYRDLQS